MLIDSHCHLTDDQFSSDRLDVLARAREAGVERIVTIASNRRDAEGIGELLTAWPEEHRGEQDLPLLWGTAGVHPHEAEAAREGDLDALKNLAKSHPRVVAIGETGLDFYYDNSPRALQESLFRAHLDLAEELDLPAVVHSRSADDLTRRILEERGDRVRGVLHCYTGGGELLHTALGMGWMVSFTGIITFKKYPGGDLIRSVPRDRLMVETDAPYLAPVPHRGRRNEPAYVARVAHALASFRDEPIEEVQAYTSSNAIRFFELTP